MANELCTFPDCDCTGRDAVKCATLQTQNEVHEMAQRLLDRDTVTCDKPRYRIQWSHNPFGAPLGYWITPYLSNDQLDQLDMRTYKQTNLPTEC